MPIVQITLAQGRSNDRKERLIKKVTETIVETLQVPKDRVRIALYELPKGTSLSAVCLSPD